MRHYINNPVPEKGFYCQFQLERHKTHGITGILALWVSFWQKIKKQCWFSSSATLGMILSSVHARPLCFCVVLGQAGRRWSYLTKSGRFYPHFGGAVAYPAAINNNTFTWGRRREKSQNIIVIREREAALEIIIIVIAAAAACYAMVSAGT